MIVLLGICVEGEEKILVYEYMPKKCLATIIADKTEWNLVNWTKRLQIIQEIANGLAYLHGHPQMCIVHRDIKSGNILLDHEMNAKITDFGLAVRLNPNVPIEVDPPVCGTIGYAAPEYIATGKISTKQDVYGFGIVLLEIMGGKLCNSYIRKRGITSLGLSLPEYAHKYQKKPQKFVDPVLRADKNEMAQIMKCFQVALLCIHDVARHRPTMSEVVTMLGTIKVVQP